MGGGEVAIGEALGEDCFSLLAMEGETFRLLILFVPAKAQPAQSLENGLNADLGVAFHVGVIETQHHGSVIVARIEPIEDEGSSTADVEKASRRRRKSNARSRSRGEIFFRHR